MRAFNDVAPYTHLVDESETHPLSFFETIVGMAYAAFADAPVEVAVVEVGMGGAWDATNVANAAVAVVLPIAVDHARYLGDTPAAIAVEKAGIIKPGSIAVLAQQPPEAAEVLLRRATEVGATVAREGMEFGVVSRVPAVGGQLLSLQGLRARYDDVFLPLYGAHQAQNAAVALAAVEAFAGEQALDEELVKAAFAEVTSPGRLEIIRRSPTIVLDAAHNPHGAEAVAAALEDSFTFSPLIGRHGRDGRQGPRGAAGGVRAACSRTSCAPRTPPSGRCRPSSWPRPPARSSARTGSPWRPPSPTPSTRRRRWPRRARPWAAGSAPARCSSPAR